MAPTENDRSPRSREGRGTAGTAPPTPKGAKRRERVLVAAEAHFGQVGYWEATTAAIARDAGLTQSALYRYFPNKQALFVEALAFRQAAIMEAIGGALQSGGTARERIEEIGAVTVDLARRFPDMARLRLQAVVVAGQDPKIRDIVHATIDRLHAAHRGLIEAAIADGSLPPTVDSEILAHAIAALANQLYVALVLEHPMIEVAGRALPTLLAMIDDPD